MENKEKLLGLLNDKHNVLLLGAPGTGKSKVMNEVAKAFLEGGEKLDVPTHVKGSAIPIPAVTLPTGINLAMLNKKHRKVFRTT